jgi:hypothetical protein
MSQPVPPPRNHQKPNLLIFRASKASQTVVTVTATTTTTTTTTPGLKRKEPPSPPNHELLQAQKIQKLNTKVSRLEKQVQDLTKAVKLLQEQMAQYNALPTEEPKDSELLESSDLSDYEPDYHEIMQREGTDYIPETLEEEEDEEISSAGESNEDSE